MGTNCRFLHTPTPNPRNTQPQAQPFPKPQTKCAFCFNRGHAALECRKRLSQLAAIPQASPATALLSREDDGKFGAKPDPTTPADDPFVVLVLTITSNHHIAHWVLDSGATSSCTFQESDCTNVRDCDIKITAAGSSFNVKRIGTACVQALDHKGRVQSITLADCPFFPSNSFLCNLSSGRVM